MASRYSSDNIHKVGSAYKVFRRLSMASEGSYAAEIERKEDINPTDASRILNVFESEGIAEKGKKTKAQFFLLNQEGVFQWFCELNEVSEQDLPDEFQDFLSIYIESYCRLEKDSTLQDMLVDDFLRALHGYDKQGENRPSWMEEVMEVFEFEAYRPFSDHVFKGISDLESSRN